MKHGLLIVDALRPMPLERHGLRSHAERGNNKNDKTITFPEN